MKISFITTVFNEENSILLFLDSLKKQTKSPDEIIIVDAFSNDKTAGLIKKYKGLEIKFLQKRGNRSTGRNEAIKQAAGDIIVCSDAGCVLDVNWVKNITKPFADKKIDVVAGYYRPIAKTIFQKCLAAYTCIMPDKLDKENFLPSSRSIGFPKSVWEEVRGYPENLDTCEDLFFAKKMKEKGFRFFTADDAIAYWPQRNNMKEAFLQFFTYAKGDGQARYFRKQTPLLFIRYLMGIMLLFLYFKTGNSYLLLVICCLLFIYLLWAVVKNYRYVKDPRAFFLLPLLQLASDIAVLSGTIFGLLV